MMEILLILINQLNLLFLMDSLEVQVLAARVPVKGVSILKASNPKNLIYLVTECINQMRKYL